jgi:hypothetical protein
MYLFVQLCAYSWLKLVLLENLETGYCIHIISPLGPVESNHHIHMAVTMNSTIWEVTLHNLIDNYRRFGRPDGAFSSESS